MERSNTAQMGSGRSGKLPLSLTSKVSSVDPRNITFQLPLQRVLTIKLICMSRPIRMGLICVSVFPSVRTGLAVPSRYEIWSHFASGLGIKGGLSAPRVELFHTA